MYVTLYDSNVHPGVNMLLGMGKLVGSNDQAAITAAGIEIQDWAQGASDRIVQLVTEVSFQASRRLPYAESSWAPLCYSVHKPTSETSRSA